MRWARDPLIRFFLLGGVLLVAYSVASGLFGDDARRRIEIGAAEVELLASSFERRWRRPPTDEELRGLVQARVREEVAYREALALGLDTDDTIVRRRMVQKMELLAQDLALMADPTEQDLQEFLAERRDAYRLPDRVSFEHIYFSVDRRGAAAEDDARALLVRIRAGELETDVLEAVGDLGDPLMVPTELYDASPVELERVFGARFAQTVFALDPGWHGPVTSPFGIHLLHLTARTDGEFPDLDDVRAELVRDFNQERTDDARERLYEGLLSGYEVSIDEEALTRATLEAARGEAR